MRYRVLKSHRSKMSITYIYVIKKTDNVPCGYYQSTNGRVVTHALGHIMYGYTLLVPMNQRVLNKPSKETVPFNKISTPVN